MSAALPLLVFSDLDGTLIDHHSYDWAAAAPALRALEAAGAGVVLASSKTAVEIDVLRRDMGLANWPAIVENGAGALGAGAAPDVQAEDYGTLRTMLDDITPHLRRYFRGFGDMTTADVSALTGLSPKAAVRAKARAFSEPGLWQGTDIDRTTFLKELESHGISAQQGGRFLTLSFGATKADQVRILTQRYQPQRTIALGDAPNDIMMLEACDAGIVIANPSRTALPTLDGEAEGRILRTEKAGPEGWNDAILGHLAQLNLT